MLVGAMRAAGNRNIECSLEHGELRIEHYF
jgi:hypothetical protein